MPLDSGDAAAAMVTAYVREFLSTCDRGAVPFRLPPGEAVVVAVFGNDDYTGDETVRRGVELLRHALDEAGLEVVGFGLAEDGRCWALLIEDPVRSVAASEARGGRAGPLTAFLREAVREAWRLAGVFPVPGGYRQSHCENCDPYREGPGGPPVR